MIFHGPYKTRYSTVFEKQYKLWLFFEQKLIFLEIEPILSLHLIHSVLGGFKSFSRTSISNILHNMIHWMDDNTSELLYINRNLWVIKACNYRLQT